MGADKREYPLPRGWHDAVPSGGFSPGSASPERESRGFQPTTARRILPPFGTPRRRTGKCPACCKKGHPHLSGLPPPTIAGGGQSRRFCWCPERNRKTVETAFPATADHGGRVFWT